MRMMYIIVYYRLNKKDAYNYIIIIYFIINNITNIIIINNIINIIINIVIIIIIISIFIIIIIIVFKIIVTLSLLML